jgi:hypothetical protein
MDPISAGVGLVGSLLGGLFASNSAKKAAQIQAQSVQQALAQQQQQFDTSRNDSMPWLQAGQHALGGQMDLLGLNGGGIQQSAIDALHSSPMFSSLYNTGVDTIEQNAAATGGLRGGNTQNSLARFGSDLLSQVIQQQLGSLGGISGTGQQTGAQLGQLGANNANANSNIILQGGANQAGAALTQGGIWSGVLNNLGAGLSGILGGVRKLGGPSNGNISAGLMGLGG